MLAEAVFAVVGDVHGEQRALVELVRGRERAAGVAVDFVLQVGDFEGNRGDGDRRGRTKDAILGDLPAFIDGRQRFPWPIWFIGGNHEPYAWLDELEPGSEVAPDCRWLGWCGTREIAGLRIGWLSGIHSPRNFPLPRPRSSDLPAEPKAWKLSTYFRESDLAQARRFGRLDVLLLHDWPSGLVTKGAPNPFAGTTTDAWLVGNPHARGLIETLRPKLTLCGHLHVGYRGLIGRTPVRCLASLAEGDAACALFRAQAGSIVEIE
jgi:hypothetical protein